MAYDAPAPASLVLPDLRNLLRDATEAVDRFVAAARTAVRVKVTAEGRPGLDRRALDAEQHAVHGFAWYATYAELFRQACAWADRLDADGRFGETEALLVQLLAAEYAAQLVGGIPMNQGEVIRPGDLGVQPEDASVLQSTSLQRLIAAAGGQSVKTRIAELIVESQGRPTVEATGLDETFEMIRDQFRSFAEAKVTPFAHGWHLRDELIPLPLVQELGELGVFGLTVPEEYGGSGLGKTAMCVVSEELSRAWIGVGSLATRSEIAAELILTGGTEAQKGVLAAQDRLGRGAADGGVH
jgi:(2S)-methylsuccinyl-CoA dehydrogenase